MMTTRQTKSRFAILLLLVVIAAASVSAAGTSAGGGAAPQLQDAPPGAGSADNQADDGGSISAPAAGMDAKSILASDSHAMGTTDDSTDGDGDGKGSGQGQAAGMQGGPHGQCVIGCASKSTEGVGCGKDLSKPTCFCKSESFIDQTFACINSTCPQQFHGAAGVIKSICSVAGAPDLQIPGYNSSSNLEHMPTINDDSNNNGTNATGTTTPGTAAPPSGSEGGAGVTSTLSVPVSVQTPPSSGPLSGSTSGNKTTTAGGNTSGAHRSKEETLAAMVAVSAVTIAASVCAWTLF